MCKINILVGAIDSFLLKSLMKFVSGVGLLTRRAMSVCQDSDVGSEFCVLRQNTLLNCYLVVLGERCQHLSTWYPCASYVVLIHKHMSIISHVWQWWEHCQELNYNLMENNLSSNLGITPDNCVKVRGTLPDHG